MPKRLPARWRPECIAEFWASAQQRYQDGIACATGGRRTGAIYLWGYSAEMALKAAYFRLIGVGPTTQLTLSGHITPAINHGRNAHAIAWPNQGQGHNVRAWAELLVAERALRAFAFPADTARIVQICGQRIGLLWSETLRYRRNVAYEYEMIQVRESVEWLLTNAAVL